MGSVADQRRPIGGPIVMSISCGRSPVDTVGVGIDATAATTGGRAVVEIRAAGIVAYA
ncbi:hypothetical protein [Streptomyces sp.]|uniref:hypothetical protein n=1 Tax=Streptomyces sp. TaxID=1931 RepID=UPI002F957F00